MSSICDRCPRRLNKVSDITEPCQLGLLNLESKGNKGCEWAVNDAASDYCFFSYIQKHTYAHTTKEICRLLNISSTACKQIERSAFEKIKKMNCEELKTLSNEVQSSKPLDVSIYDVESEELADKTLYSRHNKNSYGLNVLHKSGKPQIYGLSKKWHDNYDSKKVVLSSSIIKNGDDDDAIDDKAD